MVSVLAAISLISCVWVTALKPAYAFYLLPTRAWELLAGCLLAIYVSGLSDGGQGVSERSNRWLSFLGLGLVLASFVVIEEGAHFPGVLALLPVVGTVLCALSTSVLIDPKSVDMPPKYLPSNFSVQPP